VRPQQALADIVNALVLVPSSNAFQIAERSLTPALSGTV